MPAPPEGRQPVVDDEKVAREIQAAAPNTLMLNALIKAVRESPYCAVVQHTRVEIRRTGHDAMTHVRHARVLETIRGPAMKQITYTVTTEAGETTAAPTGPVIVALCREDGGLYWPGVGSTFPSDSDARDTARRASKTVADDQKVFSNCD